MSDYTPIHEVTPKVVAMKELLESCNAFFEKSFIFLLIRQEVFKKRLDESRNSFNRSVSQSVNYNFTIEYVYCKILPY